MPIQLAAEDKPAKNANNGSLQEQLSFKSRFVLVFGEIDDKLARITCERLIALSQESDAPIQMLISSPGGHVESGDAIHDIMRFVRAPVTTIGTGWVASAGTHIFLAVPKGAPRLPAANTALHDPPACGRGLGGRASDIAIQAKEIIKVRERIAKTNAPRRPATSSTQVLADMERDYWMSADGGRDLRHRLGASSSSSRNWLDMSEPTPNAVRDFIAAGLPCTHLEVEGATAGTSSPPFVSAEFEGLPRVASAQRVTLPWAIECARKSTRCR